MSDAERIAELQAQVDVQRRLIDNYRRSATIDHAHILRLRACLRTIAAGVSGDEAANLAYEALALYT